MHREPVGPVDVREPTASVPDRSVRQFGFDQLHRDDAGCPDLVHHVLHYERTSSLLVFKGNLGNEMIKLEFANDVTGPITRLARVKQLLESNQLAGGIRP